jgi:hypothetical protein
MQHTIDNVIKTYESLHEFVGRQVRVEEIYRVDESFIPDTEGSYYVGKLRIDSSIKTDYVLNNPTKYSRKGINLGLYNGQVLIDESCFLARRPALINERKS